MSADQERMRVVAGNYATRKIADVFRPGVADVGTAQVGHGAQSRSRLPCLALPAKRRALSA